LFILMTIQNSRKLIRLFQARRNQKADDKDTEMQDVEIKKALAIVPTNPLFQGTGETTKHLFVNTIETETLDTNAASATLSPVSKTRSGSQVSKVSQTRPSAKKVAEGPGCDECETNVATVRCEECQQNMCSTCSDSLHKPGTKRAEHLLTTISAPVSAQAALRQRMGVDDDDNTTITGEDDDNTTASGNFDEDNYVADVEKHQKGKRFAGGVRTKAAAAKLKESVHQDEQQSAQHGLATDIDDINALMTDD